MVTTSIMTQFSMVSHYTQLVSEDSRRKLIFYFIAEQLPQKLEREDRIAYETER